MKELKRGVTIGKESPIQKTIIPSGIRVITETVPHVRSVAIGFWVGVGSRDEADHESGLSHFVEHLIFQGTQTRSAQEIAETFDRLGIKHNAFTAKEYTCFYAELFDKHMPLCIEIFCDMLQNPLFSREHLALERTAIMEEISCHEDTPSGYIHDLFTSTLFRRHSLGKPILGNVRTVSQFDRDDVRRFYDKSYVSTNTVFAVAGNISHDEVVSLIDKHCKIRQAPKPQRYILPPIEKPANTFLNREGTVHICYGTKALHAHHPDRITLSILDTILGGSSDSRLFQQICLKRDLAEQAYSYHTLHIGVGCIVAYASTIKAYANEVVKLIQEEMLKIGLNGITRGEFDRAKKRLKEQLVHGLESISRKMTRLGKLEITSGEILSLDELVKRIDQVTLKDTCHLAQELFKPNKMVLTAIGPIDKETFVP